MGVQLDRGLNFNGHVPSIVNKARGVRAKLFPMFSCYNRLDVRTKVSVYLLFLRAVLTNAAPAWWSLLLTINNCRLRRFQSRTLRSFSCSLWFVRNYAIRRSLRVPTITDFAHSLAECLFPKASESSFTWLRELSTDEPPLPIRVKHSPAVFDHQPHLTILSRSLSPSP